MTDQLDFIVLNDDDPYLRCEARIRVIEDISVNVGLIEFADPTSVDPIFDFTMRTFTDVIDEVLAHNPRVRFQLSAIVTLEKQNGEVVPHVELTNTAKFLYKHKHHREQEIRKQFLKLRNPQQYKEEYGGITVDNDTSGSSYATVREVHEISVSLITPLQYNPRALSTSMRPVAGLKFTRHLDFTPYNSDRYCFFHCLFTQLFDDVPKVLQFRLLNNNKAYMAEFEAFMKEYKLEEFYDGDLFLIDNVVLIEERLKASINVYHSTEEGRVELYYRSNFKHDAENPVNILLVPLSQYADKRSGALAAPEDSEPIRQRLDLDTCKDLVSRLACLEFVNTIEAHAVVLNKSYFSVKSGKVCRYCNVNKREHFKDFASHEQTCLQHHQNVPLRERVRNYKEIDNPDKVFDRFSSFYRVPFCTYDFETRTVQETLASGKTINKHVPYSWAILYVNPFQISKSKLTLEKSQDPEELIKKFIATCKSLTRYHHDEMQSVHLATDKPRLTNEIREAGCPFCLQPFDDQKKKPEWNHSHFVNDTLNVAHNLYVCTQCNNKAMLRNKPLKFYAHNGAKYDQNLFLPTFLNDPEISNSGFLNKSESRFTEVRLGFGYLDKMGNSKYKLSFNDSLMLLPGPLASHCNAWISPEKDADTIRSLLKLFYKDQTDAELEPLVALSHKKQVFCYEALNHPALLESDRPIDRKYFHNLFTDKECSEADYLSYREASSTLEQVVGDGYNFGSFHDFYLLLDVALLGIVLLNFMNVNYELNGINPLAFLSTSAYSFNAMLKNNLYSENKIPKIEIPNVDTQRFIKRSIKGGFTMIFNKTNLKGPQDVTFGCDFASLYPACMSLRKLPYKHKETLNIENKTTQQILDEVAAMSDDLYCFLDVDIAALAPEYQEKVALYPMFPETQTIGADEYSNDQVFRYCTNTGGTVFGDQTLNTVSFYPKKNYVTSWSYLQQALEVGYEVTAIHRVEVFHAGFILKEYIDRIYKLKGDATAEFNALPDIPENAAARAAIRARIIVYKLILNAIFGFSIVNSDKHKQADLLHVEKNRDLLLRRISSPRFLGMLRVGDNVVVNQQKTSYTLEYPYMIGSSILWESKLMTSKFIFALYEYLKPKGLAIHPCFYDTDSCYISIANFRKEFSCIEDFCHRFNTDVYKLFDTSGFSAERQHPETHNALGYMTLEADGNEITDFAGVAAKCYSYKYGDKTTTTGKGIVRDLQKEYLNFDLYKSVVDGTIFQDFSREKYSCTFSDFRTTGFTVDTRKTTKQFVTLVDLKSFYGTNSTEYAVFGSEKHKALLKADQETLG